MAVFLSVGFDFGLNLKIAKVALASKHELFSIESPQDGRSALGLYTCDLVFFLLSAEHKERWPSMMPLAQLPGEPDIIAVVQDGDTEAGTFAIQSGCWDVLTMPCDSESINNTIRHCLTKRKASAALLPTGDLKREQIIGNSPAIKRLLQRLALVAGTDSSVLLLGETGTGKEVFAKAVHDNSRRADKPLVVVDCTNLPASLAESLLFGHARGSFTGAVESSDGLFKQADGGTIFLDEIGELELSVQKSLLRVIQERRFRPLSARKEVECDFRIIAATNRDLEAMVRAGTFRQDLFHRINTQTIVLPPLRERVEDIPALVHYYTAVFCKAQQQRLKEIAPETMEALKIYPWPGNIRELVNVVQAALLKATSSPCIYPQYLPEEIRLYLMRSQISSQQLLEKASAARKELDSVPPVVNTAPTSFSRSLIELTGGSLPADFLGPEVEAFAAHGEQETDFGQTWDIFESGGSGDSIAEPASGGPSSIYDLSPHSRIENSPPDSGAGRPVAASGADGKADGRADGFDFDSRAELPSYKLARSEAVRRMESSYLPALIRRAEGDFSLARKISGLSRARLYELLRINNLSI